MGNNEKDCINSGGDTGTGCRGNRLYEPGRFGRKRESQQDAYVLIKSGGSEAVRIDLEKLKQMNVVDVEANLKRSGKPAEKHVYTGVLLKEVLEEAGVDTAGKDTVIMKAVDGYTSAIGMGKPCRMITYTWCSKWTASRWVPRRRAAAVLCRLLLPRTPSARDGANL